MTVPQLRFAFPAGQVSALLPGEIVVDLFAGGGGASEGLKLALGIDPALAYNHDEWAIGMHAANHPLTAHHREDIWHADPVRDVAGRKVGWFHASPDCTHFSQAKGGQPRNRKIRALAWVIVKWVGQLWANGNAPRILSMENVWQMLSWGPLIAKRRGGRVLKMDGTVAAKGERVPVEQQQLVPDARHKGRTWRQFIATLRSYGYRVEWDKIDASDYGAGTSRVRLLLLARRDGLPIAWPEPTHGQRTTPKISAAESIDFSDLGASIFGRKKDLAAATLRRIAKGVHKHVLGAAEPFFLTEFANASAGRTWSASEPLRTQCAGVKGGHFALVTAFLEQANGGFNADNPGHDLRKPVSTITSSGSQQRLVTALLNPPGPDQEDRALRVAAFLISYYGNGDALSLRDPLDTITTRDRLALVTVFLHGTPYVIVDIRLRMLKPAELYRAQGFGPSYVIDRTADGRRVSVKEAVRMCGNSVSPLMLAAHAAANVAHPEMQRAA